MARGRSPRPSRAATPKSGKQPAEVFLSHSNKDRAFVSHLAIVLREHGVPVWYSSTNIIGAQQWHDEIGKALARCDWFVLVLSPNSVKSRWVKRELAFALRETRYEDKIAPLVYTSCDYSSLSWTLEGFQHVDFRRGFDRGCRALLRVWGLGYNAGQR